MIFGLYYNTPLFSNCRNSGLFRAFAQFVPHRLGIESSKETESNKVRVTIIKRLTKYRDQCYKTFFAVTYSTIKIASGYLVADLNR